MKSISMMLTICFLGIVPYIKGQNPSDLAIHDTKETSYQINIEFSKNIEFLGFALHIGDPEDESSELSKNHSLRQAMDEKIGQLNKEESLHKVFELGAELPYSLFVELFVRMDELPHESVYQIPEDILKNNHLDTPADLALMQEIIKQVNIFFQVSEFDQFWEYSQPWREKALEEINMIKPDDALIKAMENFYEEKFSSYKMIPSLTFWSGPGFGFRTEEDKVAQAYFVLGPLTDDYHFDNENRLETMAIHEFGHSFVNHQLESTCMDLIHETQSLYDPIAESMRLQGYPEWSYCVNEHFVRAGEVLIPELMNNQTLSESNLKWNTEEKDFIYLPFIVGKLRDYLIEEGLSYEQSIRKVMLDLKEKFMP